MVAMAAGSRLICLNNVPMEIELTKEGSADLAVTAAHFVAVTVRCLPVQEPLRVGRSVQPLPVWQQLIPDEATRNTISRIHFEALQTGSWFIVVLAVAFWRSAVS